MAVELRIGRIGEFLSNFVPKPNKEVPSSSSDILCHKGLFDFYGVPYDDLNTSPAGETIKLETRDGDIIIDCKKRVIVPPLEYYSSHLDKVL